MKGCQTIAKPVFVPKEQTYVGPYDCLIRNPSNEISSRPHYHDFFEIQFYLTDSGKIEVGDSLCEPSYGDVILINIFEPHAFKYDEKLNHCRFCISLNPTFLLESCCKTSNLLSLFNNSFEYYPKLHLEPECFSNYLELIYKYEHINLKDGRGIKEKSIIFDLLANLMNDTYDYRSCTDESDVQVNLLLKIIDFINSNLTDDLSLHRLSTTLNYSPSYISRTFKTVAGINLNEYITSKRIESAKGLLFSNLSITEICRRTGFNNYSNFYKAFVEQTGMNPKQFRDSKLVT